MLTECVAALSFGAGLYELWQASGRLRVAVVSAIVLVVLSLTAIVLGNL